jgi:endonuclease G, mitochondrial
MAKKTVSSESLKNFVRREASRFLKQNNITSVGIGYKVKDGQPTKELSIQFTVGRKVAPEALESIDAVEIPKSFLIDGVQVPTDVIQRNFEKSFREVKLEAASSRKIVANPVVPGVSIGHPSITAGTAGCVVYDVDTGTPYVLSNWHVLNGPCGKPGDPIVQPGTYDDNRISQNVVGRLVRSYLGVAGDCAIASIEQRRLVPEIFDLKVAVARIGEPDLGDRVVKSGRTTDVTYGIVKRIHVTVAIDYEEAGRKEIGCFEIGPDPDHPAKNSQISMGGDSGAAWLVVEQGKPTDLMLGLHFAGETGDEPDHALACYPSSVFEKLGIRPTKPTHIELEDMARSGYSPNFIGTSISLPEAATAEVGNDLLQVGVRKVFDYTHFSLAMSRSRRFARWVAWNIDGGALRRLSRSGIQFIKDPNLPSDAQVGDELYENNALDRGHIARRADLVWGILAEANRANRDSFFFTNITPQHESFNRSEAHGIWGELENAIYEDVEVEDLRISVMGGPIFSGSDPVYRGFQLPKQFWKIIYFRQAGDPTIKAKGFVLTQADLLNRLEVLELPGFSVYEVPISRIGEMTGLSLPLPGVVEGRPRPRGGRRTELERAGDGQIRRISSVPEIVR